MIKEIEISSLDLRYEEFRMKNPIQEQALLYSILEKGIIESLWGIKDESDILILLDGFKRVRCAQKLKINIVPFKVIAEDAYSGIIKLLKISTARNLTIVEQAHLIDELKNHEKMTVSEIAEDLEKSKAWVSLRLGIMTEMGDKIRKEIIAGRFPVYSYMYTLRQFIRINKITKSEIEEFVELTSGKHLSIRDIEALAHLYFKGGNEFKEQIKQGNLTWSLNRIRESKYQSGSNGISNFEQVFINDLEIIGKYITRFIQKRNDSKLKSNPFFAQANILASGIIDKIPILNKALKEFYDRTGKA